MTNKLTMDQLEKLPIDYAKMYLRENLKACLPEFGEYTIASQVSAAIHHYPDLNDVDAIY